MIASPVRACLARGVAAVLLASALFGCNQPSTPVRRDWILATRIEFLQADLKTVRLAPHLMQREGIEAIGTAEFYDKQTERRMMLLYFDRAAVITGHIAGRNETALDYDIRCPTAGYQWIAITRTGAQTHFAAVPWPATLRIAATP